MSKISDESIITEEHPIYMYQLQNIKSRACVERPAYGGQGAHGSAALARRYGRSVACDPWSSPSTASFVAGNSGTWAKTTTREQQARLGSRRHVTVCTICEIKTWPIDPTPSAGHLQGPVSTAHLQAPHRRPTEHQRVQYVELNFFEITLLLLP